MITLSRKNKQNPYENERYSDCEWCSAGHLACYPLVLSRHLDYRILVILEKPHPCNLGKVTMTLYLEFTPIISSLRRPGRFCPGYPPALRLTLTSAIHFKNFSILVYFKSSKQL